MRSCIAAAGPALMSCSGESLAVLDEAQVDDVTVLVSSESEMLSQPVDVTLDDEGNIYVLDRLRSQILVLAPSGALVQLIGREGSGPGEFRRPPSIAVTRDTVRVVDIGNGVLHTLSRDSDFERRTPLPIGTNISPIAVTKDGRLLGGTMGAQGALAIYNDPSGNEVAKIGRPNVPATMMLSFNQMKREIIDGKLPAIVQNATLPLFASNGDMWLILTGLGIVQRYSSAGDLLLAVPFETREKAAIWSACVERNKEILNDQRRMCAPHYVTDAIDDGKMLWALLAMPEGEAAVMVGFAPDGTLVQRIRFTRVIGARMFALDKERGRIVFIIPSNASLVAATFPSDLGVHLTR